MQYRKFIQKMILIEKFEIVEAMQWHKLGDHPAVRQESVNNKQIECSDCGRLLTEHGDLNTGFFWQRLCPGDWVAKKAGAATYFRLTTVQINEHYIELGECLKKYRKKK